MQLKLPFTVFVPKVTKVINAAWYRGRQRHGGNGIDTDRR